MQLTQALHKAVRECPNAIATIDGARRRNYRQLVDRVARLAAALRSLGLAPGARVGMLALNSDRYVEYLYGSLWAGGAVNPVNIRWSVPEIAYSLDDCDTRVLLVDDAFVSLLGPLRELSRSLTTVIYVGEGPLPADCLGYETLLAQVAPAADAQRQGSELAAVLYTGGTTGVPKGVMLSHDNLAINVLATIAAAPRAAQVPALHAAPLFHVGGIAYVFQLTTRMACQVIMPGFDPGLALDLIERERIVESFMVPTMIRRLLEQPGFAQRNLASLRTLLYGAAPIDSTLLHKALDALPNVEFVQAYGQTEVSPMVAVLPAAYHTLEGAAADKLGSAGLPVSTAELRIVDDGGVELAAGEVGEICVRGPTVMLGYWNKPEQTAAALRDGWLHSGDAGYLDADGFLFLVDRIKDMIISGGENVYSCEVENALLRHREVATCAVIGIPHERWGEAVHAIVVRQPDAHVGEAELLAHCKELIAGYKCPRSIEFRSELPLSAAGKLLKYVLREPFWKDRQRRIA
ncbi:MAG: AMP-dependent synthetase and ligase [Hydrocarboniphaga sp.]|uniref:acyl-CoA synthetase n=1 Tax=Hydrocarboniphaga sp. TaxID=2033016 RepID=UPI00262C6E83|nr:long-chain fatty acid--CoA ligase [Hydrocarboniphaga sp.]MDB5972308.1 AMP-dependent synthetase and ligase [Hydrocarboniphaga sp.]